MEEPVFEPRFIVWGQDPDPDSPSWEVVDLNPTGEPTTVAWFFTEQEAQEYCDEEQGRIVREDARCLTRRP